MSNWNWNSNNNFNKKIGSQNINQNQYINRNYDTVMKNTEQFDNNVEINKLNQIDFKIDEIKKELEIIKYNQSTKHIIHLGIKCNNCQKNNILGIRYKCFHCINYNICEDCERYLNHFHDQSHFFLRIHDTSLYNNLIQQEQQNQHKV